MADDIDAALAAVRITQPNNIPQATNDELLDLSGKVTAETTQLDTTTAKELKDNLSQHTTEYLEDLTDASDQPQRAGEDETVTSVSATPMLDFLLGEKTNARPTSEQELVAFIDRILGALADLQDGHKDLILQGRRSGMRIDYDTSAEGVSSIKGRLWAATQHSLPIKHVADYLNNPVSNCEHLVLGLALLNTREKIFNGLGRDLSTYERKAGVDHFHESLLDIIGATENTQWQACRPFVYAGKEKAVDTLMDIVREHVKIQPTDEGLLSLAQGTGAKARRHRRWWLNPSDKGLASQLSRCFSHSGLTSDEYEDSLEQQLWSFTRAAPGILCPASTIKNARKMAEMKQMKMREQAKKAKQAKKEKKNKKAKKAKKGLT